VEKLLYPYIVSRTTEACYIMNVGNFTAHYCFYDDEVKEV
jgi:hypothetical protein